MTPDICLCNAPKLANELKCSVIKAMSLMESGYTDVQQIANAEIRDIQRVPMFGKVWAERVIENAKGLK